MTVDIEKRKTRVIHPFLFGIYPIIFLYSRNVGEVFFSKMLIPTLVVLGSTFALMLLLSRLIKDRNKLAIIVTGFWSYFFLYGNVHGKLCKLTIGGKLIGTDIFLIPAWTAVFILAVVLVLIFPKNLDKLTRILNAIAICLVAMCMATIALNHIKNAAIEKTVADDDRIAGFPEPSDIPSETPDIYYIILDQRLRSDLLMEYFGYDDSPFLDQLTERGFFVADKSNSNYVQTRLSLSSSLHCTYLDVLMVQYGAGSTRSGILETMVKNNRVFDLLEKCDYTMAAFSTGYVGTEFRNADIFYSYGLSFDEYTNELVRNTVISPVIAAKQTLKKHRDMVLYAFEKLSETARLASPHFVFCHIISPHGPYVFDEKGIIDQPDVPFRWSDAVDLTRQERDRKYVAQLKFINKKTIEAIDDILANSKKPPVIILQSDHGVRWEFGPEGKIHDYRTYFGILNAYHLPGSDNSQLYESISPVNSFRVIFNRYFGANLELLEDRSYYSTYEQPFDFTDKTEQIKEIEAAQ